MLYEDVVLGGPRSSQYAQCAGEGHFLIYFFKKSLSQQLGKTHYNN